MHTNSEPDSQLSFLTEPSGDAAIDLDLKYLTSLDWSNTSIGPISAWPRELLVLINLAFLSPQPQLFLLGPDSIIIYNTSYGRLLGDHHPEYQGRPIALDTALIANATNIDRIVSRASTRVKPANEDWVPFFFLKHGVLEEVFLSATMVKLPLSLAGFHASTYDTTNEAVKARRDEAYEQIFRGSSVATDLRTLWQSLIEGIGLCEDEIPFALLYSTHVETAEDTQADLIRRKVDVEQLILEGTVGLFTPPAPAKLNLKTTEGWTVPVLQSLRSRAPVMLRAQDGTLPEAFCRSSRNRCYSDDCQTAIVLPSALTSNVDVHAVLVIGLAPRRPYDESYQSWIRTCHRTFGNLVASVALAEARDIAKENEVRRAAKERDMLAKELSLKKQEARIANNRVQRMLEIMESASVGVFECLPSGQLIQTNDSFCELSGCPKDLGIHVKVNLFDYCDSRDSQLLSSNWQSLLEAQPVTFTTRFSGGFESSQWVQIACTPVLNDHSHVTSITGCITDISAQKRIEQEAIKRAEALEKLRLSEARLLEFIENAPLGIMILNQDKYPSFVNKTWLKLTQHPTVPIEDVDVHSVILSDDVHLFDTKLDELVRSGKPVDFEMRLKRLWSTSINGPAEHAWVLFTAFPDIIDGVISQIMVAMTDINHFKFAESIQRSRLEEAIEARRQQENFVDMTSHEIRNPLSAVIHCTDAICQTMSDLKNLIDHVRGKHELPEDYDANSKKLYDFHQDMADSVDTIIACNTHQKRITDDILSLSKLDSNLLEICPSVFSIKSLLNQVQTTFTAEAGRANVTLKIDHHWSIGELDVHWIKADSGRIMQVLVNLVANAIKFTKDATSDRLVTVSTGASKTRSIDLFTDLIMAGNTDGEKKASLPISDEAFYLWFCVRDTGCGMDAAGRAKIFSRFSQASPKTYNKYGGSGLGLFISQKLTALQGGEIGFMSEADHGSTFAFYVQAMRTLAPAKSKKSDHSSIIQFTPSTNGTGPKSDHLSILLVEDNLINQKVLTKQLVRHGFIVHTADNGQEAFDFLRTTAHWTSMTNESRSLLTIDVILMDIEMPVMDGMQCASIIRAAQREGHINKHIPIIAVTANARPEQLRQTAEVGMDDAISKPFRIKDLTAVIQGLGL